MSHNHAMSPWLYIWTLLYCLYKQNLLPFNRLHVSYLRCLLKLLIFLLFLFHLNWLKQLMVFTNKSSSMWQHLFFFFSEINQWLSIVLRNKVKCFKWNKRLYEVCANYTANLVSQFLSLYSFHNHEQAKESLLQLCELSKHLNWPASERKREREYKKRKEWYLF